MQQVSLFAGLVKALCHPYDILFGNILVYVLLCIVQIILWRSFILAEVNVCILNREQDTPFL